MKSHESTDTLTTITTLDNIIDFETVEAYSGEENVNIEYLIKIIEYCNENDIEILVTYLPFEATKANISYSKYIQTICDEYNVNYINFLNLENNNTNLNNYLMLLYGEEDISYEIKISSKLEIEEDEILQALLENLNNNYEIDDDV